MIKQLVFVSASKPVPEPRNVMPNSGISKGEVAICENLLFLLIRYKLKASINFLFLYNLKYPAPNWHIFNLEPSPLVSVAAPFESK